MVLNEVGGSPNLTLNSILMVLVHLDVHHTRMVLHGIVLYITVLQGIALLASASGLYLARHLSTLSQLNLNHHNSFSNFWNQDHEDQDYQDEHADIAVAVKLPPSQLPMKDLDEDQ